MFGRGQLLRRRPHQKDNHSEIIGNTQEASQVLQLNHAGQHPQLVVSIDGLIAAYVKRVGRAQRRSEARIQENNDRRNRHGVLPTRQPR